MTTIAQAEEAILSRFVTQWGTSSPFTFDNEAFVTPSEPWVRVTIRHGPAFQDTLGSKGNRRYLRTGIVFCQIFSLTDTGTAKSISLAEVFRTAFEGVSFSGLRFFDVVYREVGNDGEFYQATATAAFDYQETK